MLLHILSIFCSDNIILKCVDEINYLTQISMKKYTKVPKKDCKFFDAYNADLLYLGEKSIILHLIDYGLVIKRSAVDKKSGNIEDEVATDLNHENIITTYMSFRQLFMRKRYQWLIMEHLEYDLAAKVPSSLQTKIKICKDVCKGLMYLKSKNIVHLDLKKENVGVARKNKGIGRKCLGALQTAYKNLTIKGDGNEKKTQLYNLRVNTKYIELIKGYNNTTSFYHQLSYNASTGTNKHRQENRKNVQLPSSKPQAMESDKDKNNEKFVYKLLDFGNARFCSKNQKKIDFKFFGTFPEISPEIYNDGYYSYQTDVFGFGTLCYDIFWKMSLNDVTADKMALKSYEELKSLENRNVLMRSRHPIALLVLDCIVDNSLERPCIEEVLYRLRQMNGK